MIVLHHCHQSRSMRVLWLLHELGVDFDVHVHPFDKSLRAPDYLTLSPAGRVPALEIGPETMFESTAMLQVLTAKFPSLGLGRGPDDLDWPDWLSWLNFAETISQSVAALIMQHITLREDHMRSPTVMRLEAVRLGKCFEAIESRLSTPVENRDFLLTSGFSAADIAVGQAVWMARFFRVLDDMPETAKWMARLERRPAFKASLPPADGELILQKPFYEAPAHG